MNKLEELQEYLKTMSNAIKGKVHVNGAPFSNAMIIVDFGNPIIPQKLVGSEANAMTALLRDATRQISRRDAAVRINSDNNNGLVYWTSI